MAQSMVDVRMGKMDPRIGTALAYMMVAYLKAMEVSEEKKPPVYPNIYRGLTVVKRVIRPEEDHVESAIQQPPSQPAVEKRMSKEVEIAPGVYKY
jgi:hypothetical protein